MARPALDWKDIGRTARHLAPGVLVAIGASALASDKVLYGLLLLVLGVKGAWDAAQSSRRVTCFRCGSHVSRDPGYCRACGVSFPEPATPLG